MRNSFRTAMILAGLLLTLGGCALLERGTALRRESYVIHEIRFPGETLALIALWYTGKAENWRELLSYNGHIKTRRMKIGDSVRIPEAMLTARTPLPRTFVRTLPPERSDMNVLLPVEPMPSAAPSPAPVRVGADHAAELTIIDSEPPATEPEEMREQLLENLVR